MLIPIMMVPPARVLLTVGQLRRQGRHVRAARPGAGMAGQIPPLLSPAPIVAGSIADVFFEGAR